MTYYRVYRTDNLTPIWVIIGLNLLVFIAHFFLPNPQQILGFTPANLLNEPWTIVTAMFTHFSIGHIFFNMLAFYFFGRLVLELVGTNNMLLIYFIGGLIGNLFCFFPNPYVTVIGASGAVYALGGALIVLRPRLRVIMFPIPVPMPLWLATLIGLIILPLLARIAWQAHLGGLIVGLIAGLLLRKRAYIVF